ncbi:MAG: alginate export family protein [Gammaproteobacteria bacterium]
MKRLLRPLSFFRKRLLLTALLAGFPLSLSAQGIEDEIAEALKNGDIELSFRYRYELVDQDSAGPADPVTDNAHASTLRTRLVYKSADFRGWKLNLGFDDVRPVVSSDFNDTRNGKTKYPTVADPKGTVVNIATLGYAGFDNTELTFGRQRINRSNQRFVGTVAWRQNEQTFDSAAVSFTPADNLQLFYAYVDSVERIFGPDSGSPSEDFSGGTHLFDAGYEVAEWLKIFGYAYLMDLEGNNDDSASNKTYGLRLSGAVPVSERYKLDYAAEYAQQKDYADNPNDYDEGYYRLDGGLSAKAWGIKASYEVLEGNGNAGESFQTPLATLHAFQGFADLFLNPLPDGIEDLFVTGKLKVAGIDLTLAYHDFSANEGSQDYGTEVDFKASVPFAEHYTFLLGGAFYNADDFATDTTKYWAMLTASF